MGIVSRTAALHIAFWQYDPWYRRAWLVWPPLTAILLATLVVGDRVGLPGGKWAKPADCSNASDAGCAATKRALFAFSAEVSNPTLANQDTVPVDRSAFKSSTADDQQKLSSALGAYYRGDWRKAVDILKSATATDPNVQFVKALSLLVPDTLDGARDAQALFRSAVAAGHRQASAMLGRTLMIGWAGVPKDVSEGRKLIEDGVAAGDSYAMRLAGVGYLSSEFGAYDSVKGVNLIQKAALAGDPVAMAQLGYSIRTGRGGLVRDDAKVLDNLRRSAEAGYTDAQYTLARWEIERYDNREIQDPTEGIKWYERAYQRGHNSYALVNLARVYRFARVAPWFDTQRSFSLLQLCAPFAFGYCHYQIGAAHHAGAGTTQDLVKAYAYYTVAQRLGFNSAEVAQLERDLTPGAKASGKQLADAIASKLKPPPSTIALQVSGPESDAASPWTAPPSKPVSAPSNPPESSPADWTACRGDNADAAIAACTRLIASGITGEELGAAYVSKAWGHFRKKQFEQAIADESKAIDAGVVLDRAYNDRGLSYEALGNFQAAVQDYQKAVPLGSVFAPNNIGRLYENGRGVATDFGEARRFYELGAERGDGYAMTNLGGLYWRGLGGPRDFDAAIRWYEKASEKGNPVAMRRLGWIFRNGEGGRSKDYVVAKRWFDQAASLGDASAMDGLGWMFRNGEGVQKDFAVAKRLFERAASLGDRSSMNGLGVLYAKAEGVPLNYAEAKRWYEKSAALGESWAMFNLGLLYEFGQGVSTDRDEARRWYEKAAALGLAEANQRLATMPKSDIPDFRRQRVQ